MVFKFQNFVLLMKSVVEIVKEFYFTHAFPKYDSEGFRYDILLDDEMRGLKENVKTLRDKSAILRRL